ncbi:MAG: M56 family metallopeptidase, partial [Lachnospiraceae bacterium]|nr:M56 family metallopeptidase [Lachnospiraceae bacterium]
MNEFIKLILSLSLSGSLLILLLILLRPLYRGRLSKNWQYYIWLVVILRLLLPVTPEASLMGSLFSAQEQRSTDNLPGPETALGQAETFYGAANTGSAVTDRHDVGNTTAEKNSPAAALFPDTMTDHESIGRVLFFLWLVVTLLLFVRRLTVYQSFVKYVDIGSRPLEDISLLERFGLIMEQHQIKGPVDLRINSLVSSPLLVGFLHPRII